MKLTESERIACGLVDYKDNHIIMEPDELKSIRRTLKLTQTGIALLLDVTRLWILRYETGKSELSYAHAFILRLLMDLPEASRHKWLNIPKRKNRTREEVNDAIHRGDIKQIAYFKKNGYDV